MLKELHEVRHTLERIIDEFDPKTDYTNRNDAGAKCIINYAKEVLAKLDGVIERLNSETIVCDVGNVLAGNCSTAYEQAKAAIKVVRGDE